MKKQIISIMTLALTTFFVASCDDESTEGMTRITYYPTIEVLGESEVYLTVGDEYSDAGCQVTLNGEDITDQAVTSSNVDTSAPGIYTVTYGAKNEDGFSKSASRTVYVLNPGSFDNLYLGESEYGTRHYYDALTIVSHYGENIYHIDDLSAGFYWNGRYAGYEAYGYDFHLEAYLQLNADNSVSLYHCDPSGWYWGEGMEMVSGNFDPATGKISMELNFGGAPLYVNLHPITMPE